MCVSFIFSSILLMLILLTFVTIYVICENLRFFSAVLCRVTLFFASFCCEKAILLEKKGERKGTCLPLSFETRLAWPNWIAHNARGIYCSEFVFLIYLSKESSHNHATNYYYQSIDSSILCLPEIQLVIAFVSNVHKMSFLLSILWQLMHEYF